MPFASHAEYFDTLTPGQRLCVEQITAEVQQCFPAARPCISYNMPAFRDGRVFFYVAAFKKHIGIYPPVTKDEELIRETARYRGPKGNLSFPHSEPLPMELIRRIALALHAQY